MQVPHTPPEMVKKSLPLVRTGCLTSEEVKSRSHEREMICLPVAPRQITESLKKMTRCLVLVFPTAKVGDFQLTVLTSEAPNFRH